MDRLSLDLFSLPPDLFNSQPLFTLALYYVVALTMTHFARRLLDMSFRHGRIVHIFLVEYISVTLLCACAYENAFVVKYYGVGGFTFIVYTLMSFNSMLNPGSYSNPLRPLELMLTDKIPASNGVAVLIAQACGVVSGPSIAMGIWYYSQELFNDHAMFYRNLPCTLNYKVPIAYAFAYEIIAAFIIRMAACRLPKTGHSLVFPAVVSFLLAVALVNIGLPGINPIIITSRMYGCRGLSESTFIALYWFCPMVGWWLGTFTEPRPRGSAYTAPSSTSSKKQQRKKQKKN